MIKLRWNLIFFITLICTTLLFVGCSQPEAYDSSGHVIRVSDYKGKWVVIQYWATWCSPCINEIPTLNTLAKYYHDKVVVLGVNTDNLSNAVLEQLRQGYRVVYPFLAKFPIDYWGVKEVPSLPTTFIIDPKGRLYQTLKGPQSLDDFRAIMHLPPPPYF